MNYQIIPGLKYRLKTKAREGADRVFGIIQCYFGISEKTLIDKGRPRNVVYPRFIAMFFLHQYYGLTFTRIGEMFNRDHTTVMNAVKVARDLVETDDEFRHDFKSIEKLLY